MMIWLLGIDPRRLIDGATSLEIEIVLVAVGLVKCASARKIPVPLRSADAAP